MKQIFHEVTVKTNGPGLYNFTKQAQDFVNKNKLFIKFVSEEKENSEVNNIDRIKINL